MILTAHNWISLLFPASFRAFRTLARPRQTHHRRGKLRLNVHLIQSPGRNWMRWVGRRGLIEIIRFPETSERRRLSPIDLLKPFQQKLDCRVNSQRLPASPSISMIILFVNIVETSLTVVCQLTSSQPHRSSRARQSRIFSLSRSLSAQQMSNNWKVFSSGLVPAITTKT